MTHRKAALKDSKGIMSIIKEAKQYFKNNNIDQWQDGYPNLNIINSDISNGYTYVLTENDNIIAAYSLIIGNEPSYDNIYNGNWLTSPIEKYAVIHRMAVTDTKKGSGIALMLMDKIEQQTKEQNIKSIRIDTHVENKSMRRLLTKAGFKYCGIVYLPDNASRIAFEKLL